MSDADFTVRVVHEARARLGEGPVWDDRTRSLFWVDILNFRVHQFFPDRGADRVFEVGGLVGCVALTHSNSLLIALRHALARLDLGSGDVERLLEVEADKPKNKLNDGKCDPQGRFWFGSFTRNQGEAALYRYDPDGSLRVMQDGMTGSNGLGWSPDGRTFYLTESGEKKIYAYDFDGERGEIHDRRVFVDLSESDATPDGLSVDAEGHVWSAQWDGACLLRFAPDGSRSRRVELPVKRPTSCAFGGPERRHLYVTSASVELSEEELETYFHSGDLFCLTTEVAGLPFHRFAG